MELQQYITILTDKLNDWLQAAVAALPNFVVALFVLIVFYLVARFVAGLTRRVVTRATASEALVGLVTGLTRYLVIACGLFVALGVLGLQKTVVSLLAGAGIVGLAIGFAFQDLAANFISGILIAFQRPFAIGDVIEAGDHLGRVRDIRLRNTLVETFSGQIVVLPNRELFENPLINYTRSGSRRVELEVGVAYDSDLKEVTEVARKAIEALDFRKEDTPVAILAKEFGGSSINYRIHYWVDYPDGEVGYLDAIHRGVLAIKRAFDDASIEIPFPIRTLDFSRTSEHAANLDLGDNLREAS